MAAAGLWTTATDLAKFAIEVQETLAGHGHGVISPAMARQYVTEQKGGYGLGVGVQGTGRNLRFSHGGRDEGFDALLIAGAETGDGVAVMINANDNSRLMGRIRDYVERAWGFAVTSPTTPGPAATSAARIDPSRLARYAGYYEAAENNMVALVANPDGSGMQVLIDGLPDENLLALDSASFGSSERPFRVRFNADGRGAVTGATLRPGEPRETTSAARGSAAELTPAETGPRRGARHADLGGAGCAAAGWGGAGQRGRRDARREAGLRSRGESRVRWRRDGDVPRRGGCVGPRHSSPRRGGSARPDSTACNREDGQRYLLVHLTAAGSVTDYDVVTR